MSKFSKYRLLLILAAAVLFLDQATKLWVVYTLPEGSFWEPQRIDVISGFFHIVHVTNTGAAWSMFSGYTWPLTAVGFVVLGFLYFFRKALELDKPKIQLGYGLIIGGIIGNMIDRIRIQKVIDFLDFQFGDYHFPSFNIADSGITVGVILYIWFSFRQEKEN
ncbi:signal peptidase II [Pelagicoccus sp. NFK12]|uniref:Lipoprotein signal peptidase n=1 Tax=Pelagicoccus enzymogenes TaxID=2773457 RepID=A0A927FBT9_9BACT|nr:signal peptidase II [Pelagicoccus enzymogenes]MBD5781974.1 signal peptidase II [Pelagicoccus enzymogenes]MDQ8196729.1 signal peptidase II [Pelagicoccus enzymogenes]